MRIKFLILKYVIISSKKLRIEENLRENGEYEKKWKIIRIIINCFKKKKNPKKGKVLERA